MTILPDVPVLDDLVAPFRAHNYAAQRIERAFLVAQKAHEGQTRDEGTPYIQHPLRVAGEVLFGLRQQDADMVCAALLHDVIEDSSIRREDLQHWFGSWVANAVQLLSKEKVQTGHYRGERDSQYYNRLWPAEGRVLLIKLCDRLDNLRHLHLSPDEEKKSRYCEETRHLVNMLLDAPGLSESIEKRSYFVRQYTVLGIPVASST